MTWNNITTQITGHLVTAAEWNDIGENMAFLEEVGYTEFTADVSITATTVGTANQVVSSGAIDYEAVPHLIEFYCARFTPGVGLTNVILRDATTVLGQVGWVSASGTAAPMPLARRLTPTAASHTYNIAAWVASGTGTFEAGSGGAAGDSSATMPGFIRITRIPT